MARVLNLADIDQNGPSSHQGLQCLFRPTTCRKPEHALKIASCPGGENPQGGGRIYQLISGNKPVGDFIECPIPANSNDQIESLSQKLASQFDGVTAVFRKPRGERPQLFFQAT